MSASRFEDEKRKLQQDVARFLEDQREVPVSLSIEIWYHIWLTAGLVGLQKSLAGEDHTPEKIIEKKLQQIIPARLRVGGPGNYGGDLKEEKINTLNHLERDIIGEDVVNWSSVFKTDTEESRVEHVEAFISLDVSFVGNGGKPNKELRVRAREAAKPHQAY